MKSFCLALWHNNRGGTAIEYGLIVALVVIAMIAGMTGVSTKTIGMWNNVSNTVQEH